MKAFQIVNPDLFSKKFALTTDTLTICFQGSVECFTKFLMEKLQTSDSEENSELVRSIESKLLFKSLNIYYSCFSGINRVMVKDKDENFVFNVLQKTIDIDRHEEDCDQVDYCILSTAKSFDQKEKEYIDRTFSTTGSDCLIPVNHLENIPIYMNECEIVSTLQRSHPVVTRIKPKEGVKLPHSNTDLVKKVYSFRKYGTIANELAFHNSFSHPNILPLLEYYVDATCGTITLFMEYKKEPGYLPTKITDVRKYMRQLLEALKYLAENSITHHNIKPDNIIFDPKTKQLYIIDFEHCKFGYVNCHSGNCFYLAPEKYDRKAKVGPKCDVYSAGHIFWQMLLKKDKNSRIINNKDAWDLVNRMLQRFSDERISAEAALNHAFFNEKRWF